MKRFIRFFVPFVLVLAIIGCTGWYLLKYDPDFTRDLLVSQARAFDKQGSHGIATWFYSLAYRQSGNDERVAIELAEQYKAIGNYSKAEHTLSNAIADGGTAELYIALCKTYVEQDKLLDAVTMLNNIADPNIKAQLELKRPNAPIPSVEPGYYNQYISVMLSSADGTIYVSTDSEYPSTSDTPYETAISLPGGETTISAVTVSEEGLVSRLTLLGYTIGGVVEEVTLSDVAIDASIRQLLQVSKEHTLYTDELWTITEFQIPGEAASLSDLRLLPFLTKLTLSESKLENIGSSLSSLVNLETLEITDTILSSEDLQVIGNLPKLTKLTLSGCSLSGIGALSGSTKLTYLDLRNNTIRDLTAISAMSNLETLLLSQNAVTALDALGKLTKLKELDVSYNSITSVSPLAGCAALTTLNLSRNSIVTLEGLGSLGSLTTLSATFNDLTDVSALAANTNLVELDLSSNAITDISMLTSLVNMTDFNFSDNQVSRLPAFSKDCALVTIDGSKNLLTTLDELKGLERLNYVFLDYNTDLTSVDALTACYHLVKLSVYGTGVTDVSALKDMNVIVQYTPI